MVKKTGKRKLITALAVLIALLVIIGAIALIRATAQKSDPYTTKDPSSSKTEATDSSAAQDTTKPTDTSPSTDGTASDPVLDPATVSSIAISPMSITVSYVKGIGSFEYQVLRTANGTRYVEFRNADLVGTKCTNDTGTFASILDNPDSNEGTTLTKTVTVDGTKYGLSLESATCTANSDKLQAYQKSFSDAFSLLKKIN
jgi:cytoskeletal protein RodZ